MSTAITKPRQTVNQKTKQTLRNSTEFACELKKETETANKAPSVPFSLFFTLDSFSVILLLAQCSHVKPFNTKDLNALTSVHLQNSRLLDNLQELRQWHSRGLKLAGDHLLAPIVYL